MTKDRSGPAFPVPAELCQDLTIEEQRGLTVRDYFAIHATEEDIQRHLPTGRTVVAANALTGKTLELPEYRKREQARYAFADAMLKARQA